MKTLLAIYRQFSLLHICPAHKSINQWTKLLNILLLIICPMISFSGLIASFVFFLQNVRTDLKNAIYACFQIIGQATAFYSYIMAYVKRKDLKKIFDAIQQFFDASK